MYGLEAINAHNGWSMAVVGIIIVFCGLAILSFSISQISKILLLTESRKQTLQTKPANHPDVIGTIVVPATYFTDPAETALYYQPLADQLGDTFQLSDLHRLCREYNFPSPHLSVRNLRSSGILCAEGNGFFRWAKQ